MTYMDEYHRWCEMADEDPDLTKELKTMTETEIGDAFYRNLSFGTGGLRGTLGAGTNRMNVYTVAKASQGLADYLLERNASPSVVIGRDSRNKSDLFAKVAARVFAANGLTVHFWPSLLPVPTVSFATRYLKASAGVMITASHNPSTYNGYKVYGGDGCQITTEDAKAILTEIEKLDLFRDIRYMPFQTAVDTGKITFIPEEVLTAFLENVKKQSVLFGDPVDKDISIVYSPLNGTGYIPVTRILQETGYRNVTVVEEQRLPDGNFPTCPYPNPEVHEAMALGIEYAKKSNAQLLLATDPDCDRVGIAVQDQNGEFVLLSGNETGILLLDYICAQRTRHEKMPQDPVMIKTIVTTDLGERIAEHYGVKVVNVLTGFKYIGEQIGLLEKQGKADDYIFGFEESYGYLSGEYVRDKDGVNGAFLICEMYSYYAARGVSLTDRLNDLYRQFGYCLNTLHSYKFEGACGFEKMQSIMKAVRKELTPGKEMAGRKIRKALDYSQGLDGLPKADVLKYYLEDGSSVTIRPSGTEPKMKMYSCIIAGTKEEAAIAETEIINDAETFFK